MPKKEVFSQAGDVTAEDGVVHWDGPDGVDVGLASEMIPTVTAHLNAAKGLK
jgi:hypothetical protein